MLFQLPLAEVKAIESVLLEHYYRAIVFMQQGRSSIYAETVPDREFLPKHDNA